MADLKISQLTNATTPLVGTEVLPLVQSSGTKKVSVTNLTTGRTVDMAALLVGKTSASVSSVGVEANNTGAVFSSIASNLNNSSTYHAYSTTDSSYRFYVGMAGTVFATSTTISSLSDARFKENIRDLNVGLSEVMALKPRLYDWKKGKGADTKNARGFIAQEFETVFPDLIDEWKDPSPKGEEPYKSVRQDLIPVLVRAIQEQQALIASLQVDVAALKTAA